MAQHQKQSIFAEVVRARGFRKQRCRRRRSNRRDGSKLNNECSKKMFAEISEKKWLRQSAKDCSRQLAKGLRQRKHPSRILKSILKCRKNRYRHRNMFNFKFKNNVDVDNNLNPVHRRTIMDRMPTEKLRNETLNETNSFVVFSTNEFLQWTIKSCLHGTGRGSSI